MAGCRYHNIDANPVSTRKTWPYIGWAKDGTKYYISDRGGKFGRWRAAQVVTVDGKNPPYFYGNTLRYISEKLETIGDGA